MWAASGPLWLREAEAGRALIERRSRRARAEAAIGALPALLDLLGRDQATTDRWPAAEASYDEAIRLARETGQRAELGAALAGLAWLEARQGREAACRAHAAEARRSATSSACGLFGVWAAQALGDLELGLGTPGAAVEHHLEAQAERLRAAGIADVDMSPAPELVDAYMRLGRRDEAAAIAARFAPEAEAKGQPWALRARRAVPGLVAEPGDAEALFERGAGAARADARRVRDRTHAPRLRRAPAPRAPAGARPRAAARGVRGVRAPRRRAVGRPGRAPSWRRPARRPGGAMPSTLDQLTPQELQIAQLLAEGRTTREAAAAIFLSPKTVEYHLRHVYQKLGINSREELASRFS